MEQEIGTLNMQQVKNVILAEMDLWRRSARKSRKEKFISDAIMITVDAGRNVLAVIEEKLLLYFVHENRMTGNRLPRRILD